MNLIDFQSILSSPSHSDRIRQFPLTSIVFNMINGCAFREEDLVGVNVNENEVNLEFRSEDKASNARNILSSQVVPGVCGGQQLYILEVSSCGSLLKIIFKDE